jgi:mRNA-degrading endonuclease toxin of MazEF toxin-antitoxin module
MARGTIVWVDLSDASSPEMSKVRPGIVVSGTVHNEVLSTVVVVPTSSVPPAIPPLRVAVGNMAGKASYAVVPGIRQVSKSRLRGAVGVVSPERLRELDSCLAAYLGRRE